MQTGAGKPTVWLWAVMQSHACMGVVIVAADAVGTARPPWLLMVVVVEEVVRVAV